jgi:NAD-dependent SIR2 family protein deacetylase
MGIENVIFLGAGASASEGAPVQGAILKEYFISYQKKEGSRAYHEMDRDLATFFEAFFGIDVDHGDLGKVSFPTFEEVLGILELSLARNESFREYSLSSINPLIQKIRDHLILLIALILAEKLGDGPSHHHRRLVNKLQKDQALQSTAFVCVNYDILIDNAISECRAAYGLDLDYGVDFANTEQGQVWEPPRRDRAVNLFKLHGSLNWLYCPTCVSLTLTPEEKGVIKLKWEINDCICPKCKTLSTPIVIPPTFFKVMGNFYLQEIWRKTEHALMLARRIFFCGYSFPDADIHIKYLLKRVELNRKETPEIFVINNHSQKDQAEKAAERDRYERFFRDRNKVHYTDKSFEEFAESGFSLFLK